MLGVFRRAFLVTALGATLAAGLATGGQAAAVPRGATAATVGTQAAASASTPESGSCRVVNDAEVVRQRVVTGSGVYSHALWLTKQATMERARQIRITLEARYGASTKDDPMAALRAGLVGTTIDHRHRRYVVVVGRGTRDAPAVRAEIARAFTAVRSTRTGASFTVVESCRSAADLYAAYQTIHTRSWARGAKKASIEFWLNPADSTWHVAVDPRHRRVAASLGRRLGSLGKVTVSPVRRAGRMSDGEPHYGGAAIGLKNDRFCSAGFIVKRSNGVLGGVTAGHCFANGTAVYSGDKYWGASGGKSNYPRFDMMWVSSSNETYDNVIHTDPCCPNTRTVTSGGDPDIGWQICASGMVTKAVCGITVQALNGELCDADGCTTSLIRATKDGDVIVRGGDSGGPVYTRPTGSTAAIRGMVVGHNGDVGTNLLAERYSFILDHLNVTLKKT